MGRQSAESCRWMMESTGTARKEAAGDFTRHLPASLCLPGNLAVCLHSFFFFFFFSLFFFFLLPRWNVHEGFALCAKRPRPPRLCSHPPPLPENNATVTFECLDSLAFHMLFFSVLVFYRNITQRAVCKTAAGAAGRVKYLPPQKESNVTASVRKLILQSFSSVCRL